jgi:hypothetical protein
VVFGLGVAAVAAPILQGSILNWLPPGVEVLMWALVGIPVEVCASGATPMVAVLVAAGVSPGAGVAFLLTGPASNLSTVGVLARLHGRRTALAFAAMTLVVAVVLGVLVNLALPGYQVPSKTSAAGHEHGLGSEIALYAVAIAMLASLLRQGPRAFLGQILELAAGSGLGHSHDHDHDRDHDHGHAAAAHAGCGCDHGCATPAASSSSSRHPALRTTHGRGRGVLAPHVQRQGALRVQASGPLAAPPAGGDDSAS